MSDPVLLELRNIILDQHKTIQELLTRIKNIEVILNSQMTTAIGDKSASVPTSERKGEVDASLIGRRWADVTAPPSSPPPAHLAPAPLAQRRQIP